jgi:hypothetical protein
MQDDPLCVAGECLFLAWNLSRLEAEADLDAVTLVLAAGLSTVHTPRHSLACIWVKVGLAALWQ